MNILDTRTDLYLKGIALRGEDFTPAQEARWYEEEQVAYRELDYNDEYDYPYHALNTLCGYDPVFGPSVNGHASLGIDDTGITAVGIGSAHGVEFDPISLILDEVMIVDPDTSYEDDGYYVDGALATKYVVPGKGTPEDPFIPATSNSADLVTCFGVLHHIAKVGRVIDDIYRVLTPGGVVLIREPIVSMGDWREPRKGLTKNERGIPISLLRQFLAKSGFYVVKESYCGFAPLRKVVDKVTGRNMWSSRALTKIDLLLSKLSVKVRNGVVYHPMHWTDKIGPTSTFIVARKPYSENSLREGAASEDSF